jgi:2-methylcitrate dehydratase
MHGITGPLEVFEGNKGFMDAIAGHFEIDWQTENLEIIRRTNIKKYNAEFHSQSALEGILELREANHLQADAIERIEIEIFDVAYNIIGGGEEGDKHNVHTKEEADHSLPYMVAVALLDGEVTPRQYTPKRIERRDVQTLLRKVEVRPSAEMSELFPEAMPCRIQVFLNDGRTLSIEKEDYEGFYTHPMSWTKVAEKFEQLAQPFTDEELRRGIIEAVARLETLEVAQLADLLTYVRKGEGI